MNAAIGLFVLRLAIGGVVFAHGAIKIGWPSGFWAGGGKQLAGVEFPIPLAAGALAIALIGFGDWSLDAALGLTYPDWLTPAWLALMLAGAVSLLAIRWFRLRQPNAGAA